MGKRASKKSKREFMDALKAWRSAHGLSQSQAAEHLGVPLKTLEGTHHPDRDAQFRYLNDQITLFLSHHLPVVSVDTKKKELVGSFKNGGREWQPKGQPEPVNVHDFPDPALGKAIPYASTISAAIRAGSPLANTTIPPASQWRVCAAGGM